MCADYGTRCMGKGTGEGGAVTALTAEVAKNPKDRRDRGDDMDRLLRALADVFAFDESDLCVLRISAGPVGRELVLADGTPLNPQDAVIRLYTWPEHLPPLHVGVDGTVWASSYEAKLRYTLHRLRRYLHNHPELNRTVAATGLFIYPEGHFGERGQGILNRLGLDPDSLTMSPHGVDPLLTTGSDHPTDLYERWLRRRLTRSYARLSLTGRAVGDRRWISRDRLDQLHAEPPPGTDADQPYYWERYAPESLVRPSTPSPTR